MKRNKIFMIMAFFAMIFGLSTSCAKQTDMSQVNSFAELNALEPTIAYTSDNDLSEEILELCPNANLVMYQDLTSCVQNLKNGKWTAATAVESVADSLASDTENGIRVLQDPVTTFDIALGLYENCTIPDYEDRVNAAIQKLKDDGTLEEMKENWNVKGIMPDDITLHKDSAYTIHCATFGEQVPNTYYQDGELVGFDVELAYRVADIMECNIVFEAADFPSMLLGCSSGKYDMIASNLFVTDVRRDNFLFSVKYDTTNIMMMIYDPTGCSDELEYDSLEDLNNCKAFAVLTGSIFDSVVKELYPNAELKYYNTLSDCGMALSQGWVDAVVYDDAPMRFYTAQNDSLGVINEKISEEKYYFLTGKAEENLALANKFNTWLKNSMSQEELDEMYAFWTSAADAKAIDYDSLPSTNGTLEIAAYSTGRPDVFVSNGKLTGYSVELVYDFCKATGYGMDLIDTSLDSALSGVATGKYDLATNFFSYTETRAESFTFTDAIATGGISVMVRHVENTSTNENDFFESLIASFRKTFISEDRWQMILSGIGITMLITALGFLLANLLGVGFCALSLSKHKICNILSGIYSYVMQGTPVVVVLMILYYIVFGKTHISGEVVAILGFGLVSGSALARIFKGGIQSVDAGQKEAALALGFTKPQTFFNITFPQAARSVLPGYFSQLIALMQSTSIVGYIAVQDLTKIGDIIRNATYEAFFPLIAVALIYFALSSLLLFILKLIQKQLAKKHRKTTEVKK